MSLPCLIVLHSSGSSSNQPWLHDSLSWFFIKCIFMQHSNTVLAKTCLSWSVRLESSTFRRSWKFQFPTQDMYWELLRCIEYYWIWKRIMSYLSLYQLSVTHCIKRMAVLFVFCTCSSSRFLLASSTLPDLLNWTSASKQTWYFRFRK